MKKGKSSMDLPAEMKAAIAEAKKTPGVHPAVPEGGKIPGREAPPIGFDQHPQ